MDTAQKPVQLAEFSVHLVTCATKTCLIFEIVSWPMRSHRLKREAAEAGNQSGSPMGCQREAFCAIESLSTHGHAKESSSEGKW